MNLLKLMKYGPAILVVFRAIEGARDGTVDVPVRGVRVPGNGIWDLDLKGARRPEKANG